MLNGGSGNDTVSYSSRTEPVTADPDSMADDGVANEGDKILSNVENIIGGSGNDTCVIDDGDTAVVCES